MSEEGDVTLLIGDGRTREVRLWKDWLEHVPSIRTKFYEFTDGFDPFHSNETASVAVLANAAALAGLLSNTEYVALKRHTTRGRPYKPGRCDLWVADVKSETSWAFEFKQHFGAAGLRETTFETRLDHALKDAKAVDKYEGDRRVGCLILVPNQEEPMNTAQVEHFDRLCEGAHLAFRIGGGLGPIWIAFKFVQ